MSSPHSHTHPPSTTSTNNSVASASTSKHRACVRCHRNKTACAGVFPCPRCVRLGCDDECREHQDQRGGAFRTSKKRQRTQAQATTRVVKRKPTPIATAPEVAAATVNNLLPASLAVATPETPSSLADEWIDADSLAASNSSSGTSSTVSSPVPPMNLQAVLDHTSEHPPAHLIMPEHGSPQILQWFRSATGDSAYHGMFPSPTTMTTTMAVQSAKMPELTDFGAIAPPPLFVRGDSLGFPPTAVSFEWPTLQQADSSDASSCGSSASSIFETSSPLLSDTAEFDLAPYDTVFHTQAMPSHLDWHQLAAY